MLCQKCGHFEATVHTEEMVFRQKIEQHLCPLCAGSGEWRPPEEQYVTVVSSTSRMKRGGKRELQPLENVSNGLAAVGGYLARLYAATQPNGWLTIQTDSGRAILVMRIERAAAAFLLPVMTPDRSSELERRVREFLERHKVNPLIDAPQALSYRLPDLPAEATTLVVGLLLACFNVDEQDALGFRLLFIPEPEKPR